MTESNTTPEATEATTDQPETPQEAPETDLDTEGTPGDANPSKEAAKYRRQLRATERERDQLAEQVTALRRAAVEDLVTAQKVNPAGFWAVGNTVEDMLDETGGIDPEKVTAAADRAVAELGLERIGHNPPSVPKEGAVTNARGTKSWESAFGAQ